MATYKNGFKKQNTELLLLKTIVAIIVAVILIVVVAFIYDSMTKWRDYNNYETVENYEDAFSLKDDADQELFDYVIYVYSNNNTCESCDLIRNDLLKLANRLDENTFFLLDVNNVDGEQADFLDTIERTAIAKPMLVIVNDGEFYELSVGSEAVLNTMKLIEEGNYTPFN